MHLLLSPFHIENIFIEYILIIVSLTPSFTKLSFHFLTHPNSNQFFSLSLENNRTSSLLRAHGYDEISCLKPLPATVSSLMMGCNLEL